MAIIRKKIKNSIYVYDVKSYREDGKVKTKWNILGKLDGNGTLISSRKFRNLPAEIQEVETVTKEIKIMPLA